MPQHVTVNKGRYKVLIVSLPGVDLSGDFFASDIRETPSVNSALIVSWGVGFESDGTDGRLRLVLDDSLTVDLPHTHGFMDIKRITGGQPVKMHDEAIPVKFEEMPTA